LQTWDCDVEKSAQASADRNAVNCGMVHAQGTEYGENLFGASGYAFVAKSLFNSSVNLWYAELAKYGLQSKDNVLTENLFNTGIGHWTQVGGGFSFKYSSTVETRDGMVLAFPTRTRTRLLVVGSTRQPVVLQKIGPPLLP
jgi:hypothetical protein